MTITITEQEYYSLLKAVALAIGEYGDPETTHGITHKNRYEALYQALIERR